MIMNFDMKTKQNSATFNDPATALSANISSYDNYEFTMVVFDSVGVIPLGTVTATDDNELNEKLTEMYNGFIRDQSNSNSPKLST